MIITRLNGGLGNQLFQYAVGRQLAEIHGTELKLDLRWFGRDDTRPYRLDLLNIIENIASPDDVWKFPERKPSRFIKYTHNLKSRLFSYTLLEEADYHYDQRPFLAGRNTMLWGFWQSEKYFKPIETTIRREFTLKQPLTGRDREVADSMAAVSSVALHVRRGDTVVDPGLVKKIGSKTMDYFADAVKIVADRVPNPHFFIFTDDHPWSRENLRVDYPMVFVDHNDPLKNCEELFLMAQAKHHIIANSTFSWWAAWLNSNPQKTVVAPKQWFNQAKFNTQDLIPEPWIRV